MIGVGVGCGCDCVVVGLVYVVGGYCECGD